jgi:hypothetical protein
VDDRKSEFAGVRRDQFPSIFWMIGSKFDIVRCRTADASIGTPCNSMTARNSDPIEKQSKHNFQCELAYAIPDRYYTASAPQDKMT